MLRKTKIVCTLGPATDDENVMRQLMLEGMNVARINFSHGTMEEHLETINRVKKMREELNLPVAVLLDTSGPEIRLGNFEQEKVTLEQGKEFVLTAKDVVGTKDMVSITYKKLMQDVKEGMKILLDDGLIEMSVLKVTDQDIVCRVENGGVISSHKGVNVPGAEISMKYISPKDKEDITFGAKQGIDFVAASFVRSAHDVMDLRNLLKENGHEEIKIIAKIENRQGIEHIDEILEASDGVMVARGDMGVEIPLYELPPIQKKIIKKTLEKGKIAITATQMLDSMMKNPRPTRAETTDVANAIYDGTSAIMLSGETAAGDYPVEALRMMVRIADRTEQDIDYKKRFFRYEKEEQPDVTDAICHATCTTAHDLNAKAVITVTKSGRSARAISRYRPACPIIGCTMEEKVSRQINLSWGVYPIVIKEEKNVFDLFAHSIVGAKEHGYLESGDTVVITSGVPIGKSGTTNMMKVDTVH